MRRGISLWVYPTKPFLFIPLSLEGDKCWSQIATIDEILNLLLFAYQLWCIFYNRLMAARKDFIALNWNKYRYKQGRKRPWFAVCKSGKKYRKRERERGRDREIHSKRGKERDIRSKRRRGAVREREKTNCVVIMVFR